MRRALLALLVLAGLLLSGAALAQEDGELASGGDGARGCPVVCSQYEACVEHRCVEMCRAGCRPGTFCTSAGECETLPEPSQPILTEEDRQRLSGGPSADSKMLVFVDLGGIVGFGVKPGLEWGTNHSLIARFQLLNTGIMSHAVFAENEQQRFDWGFGTSFGYRRYGATWGNLRGFYFGGGLDYTAIRVSDRLSEERHQLLHAVAPFGEFGYRWVSKDIAFGFGPTVSLRYPIGTGFSPDNVKGCSSPITCEEVSNRRFEGTLHIEIGWYQ